MSHITLIRGPHFVKHYLVRVWLYERNKRKKYRLDGVLLRAEWSCEPHTFLPKPFRTWPSCSIAPFSRHPRSPGIISNSVLFPASGISSLLLCLSNLIPDRCANTSFFQVGPQTGEASFDSPRQRKRSSSCVSTVLCVHNQQKCHFFVAPGEFLRQPRVTRENTWCLVKLEFQINHR